MRFLSILLVAFVALLSSCVSSKKSFVVKLTMQKGYTKELGLTESLMGFITADSAQSAYAARLGLDTFIMAHYQHRPWEHDYALWKEGKLDSARVAMDAKRMGVKDPFPATLPATDGESIYLLGRKPTGEYIVIADENNNNSLEDDAIHTLKKLYDRKVVNAEDSLPVVHMKNLQAFYEGGVISFTKSFRLKPMIGFSDPSVRRETTLQLEALSGEYALGKFRYKGKRYKLAERAIHTPGFSDDSKQILIKLARGNERHAFNKAFYTHPSYREGDTMVLGKAVFLIEKVPALMNSITLKSLAINPNLVKPKTYRSFYEAGAEAEMKENEQEKIGTSYPGFSATNETASISKEAVKGKVVFINFWFASCAPCLAEFKALDDLYEKLKDRQDFAFISFTYEKPEKIAQIRKQYNLHFPIYTISGEQCRELNLGNNYPTNIILDKEGVVRHIYVGSEEDPKKVKKFVDSELYVAIVAAM